MSPEYPKSLEPEAFDPDTAFMTGMSLRTGDENEVWALIRYVGQPLGEFILLDGRPLDLGRAAGNALCLPDPEISRHHARLEIHEGDQGSRVLVTDRGSTNGTFVNGWRIEAPLRPQVLAPGDVLRVGSHAFKLKRLDALERSYHETMLAQSTLDTLTGVSNRATVLGFLEKQAELARRHGRPLSVILCDLDHFKTVNDRFGHPTGDLALQVLARKLTARLRASDHVGRIGGEEFLLVLPETPGTEAVSLAEDLRRGLAGEALTPLGRADTFRLAGSFGVATFQEGDANGGAVLARADVALYRAKGLGRNRVEFDGPG